MLVAAAEPVGDPAIVWRAARSLGIATHAARAAEGDGLIEFGTRVRFRHPVVRSCAYHAASLDERSRTHRALADATDAEVDPDRRAWHLAQATTAPDDTVVAELERSATRPEREAGSRQLPRSSSGQRPCRWTRRRRRDAPWRPHS